MHVSILHGVTWGRSPPMLTIVYHKSPLQLALRPTELLVTQDHPGTRHGQGNPMLPICASVLETLLQQLGEHAALWPGQLHFCYQHQRDQGLWVVPVTNYEWALAMKPSLGVIRLEFVC